MTTAIKGHQNLNYNNFNMNKYSPFDINLLNLLIYIIFLSFLSSKNYIGQEKNILLNRDFWRSQPSIEKIDSCINIKMIYRNLMNMLLISLLGDFRK